MTAINNFLIHEFRAQNDDHVNVTTFCAKLQQKNISWDLVKIRQQLVGMHLQPQPSSLLHFVDATGLKK